MFSWLLYYYYIYLLKGEKYFVLDDPFLSEHVSYLLSPTEKKYLGGNIEWGLCGRLSNKISPKPFRFMLRFKMADILADFDVKNNKMCFFTLKWPQNFMFFKYTVIGLWPSLILQNTRVQKLFGEDSISSLRISNN